MSNFDDEFEAAPEASFDDEFEQAEEVVEPNTMDKVSKGIDYFLDKPSPLGPSLRETGETAIDGIVGLGHGSLFGATEEIAGGTATALEKLIKGASSFTPGTDENKLSNLEEGDLDVSELPSLSPELQKKLQGQKAASIDMPEESIADTYAGYHQASKDFIDASKKRSPIAFGAGQLVGNIASGVAGAKALGIAQGAKGAQPIMDIASKEGKLKAGLELLKRTGTSYGKAIPALAAEGVVNSENTLVGENAQPWEVLKDTGDNLLFGAAGLLGMNAVTDVAAPVIKKAGQKTVNNLSDWIDGPDNPVFRRLKRSYVMGTEGVNPARYTDKENLLNKQVTRATDLTNDILKSDSNLGREVGESLKQADIDIGLIDIEKPVREAIDAMNFSYDELKSIAKNSRGRQIFDEISNKMNKGIVKPTDAKALLDDVDAFIGKFRNSGNRTTAENDALDALYEVRENLSKVMKDQIPEYKKTAERFADFRRSFVEPVVAGETPNDFKKVFYGDLTTDDKLYQRINTLAMKSAGEGSSFDNAVKALGNAKKGLSKFKTNEATRGKTSAFDSDNKFFDTVRDYSDEAQILNDVSTVKNPNVGSGNLLSQVMQLGKSGATRGANIAGRLKNPTAKLAKRVYNMAPEALTKYADKLEKVPGLERYGRALREGLQNGDQARKNAALFTIMQNPSARIFFDDEIEVDDLWGKAKYEEEN
jgi:hypothetical protein